MLARPVRSVLAVSDLTEASDEVLRAAGKVHAWTQSPWSPG